MLIIKRGPGRRVKLIRRLRMTMARRLYLSSLLSAVVALAPEIYPRVEDNNAV
jgi:hypothetical protein